MLSPLLCNIYYGSAELKIFGSSAEVRVAAWFAGAIFLIPFGNFRESCLD